METLIHIGGECKALGDGRFRAPLVMFGREATDLDADYFTADTDLWQDFSQPVSVPFLYAHGLDPQLKHTKLGSGKIELTRDNAGVWIEGQLKISDAYQAKIYEMIEAGKIGTSSGSIAHLVSRQAEGKAFELKSWPIAEASLTPRPCNPLNKAQAVKDFQGLDIPEFKDVMSITTGYAPANNRGSAPATPLVMSEPGTVSPPIETSPGGSTECPACHLHCHFDETHKHCPYCGQELKPTTDTAPLAGKAFADELTAALAAVDGCCTRAGNLHTLRVKSDRNVSVMTRQKVQEIADSVTRLLGVITPGLPAETKTDTPAETKTASSSLSMTLLEAEMALWAAEAASGEATFAQALLGP